MAADEKRGEVRGVTDGPGASGDAKPRPDGALRLKKLVKPVLMVLAGGFVALAAWDLVRRWEPGRFQLHWGLAALSGAPLLAASLLQGMGWIALIDKMTGKRVPRGPALALYLDSQLARYTPGKVGLPLVRMAGAGRIGAPAGSVGSSVLVEMMSWTAVGSGAGFTLLYLTNEHASGVTQLLGRWGLPLVGLCLAGLFALMLVDRRWIPASLLSRLGLTGEGPLVPPSLPLVHVGYWSAWAVHGWLLAQAVSDVSGAPSAATGLCILGPVLGFVALAAPAGVGVREAVLAAGLAPLVGSAPALTLAVASRFLSLLADLGAWLVLRPWRNVGALRE
jgi:hypothetical protein